VAVGVAFAFGLNSVVCYALKVSFSASLSVSFSASVFLSLCKYQNNNNILKINKVAIDSERLRDTQYLQ